MSDAGNALSGFTDEQLIREIMSRRETIVASIWTVADTRGKIEEDDSCGHLTEAQIVEAGTALLQTIGRDLQDVLGSRGNEFIDDRWMVEADEILREVDPAAPSVA